MKLMYCWVCAEDLEGLKVAHDFEELDEGEERILTLKDSRILENEGMWDTNQRISFLMLTVFFSVQTMS